MAKKKNSSKRGVGIGMAVTAAAAAAAAGAYFLYGSKSATKNRKKVKGWMLKAKGEVLERIEGMKEHLSQGDYEKVIEGVMERYRKMSSTSGEEVNKLARELKSHWKKISKTPASKPARAKSKPATRSKK